MQLSNTAIEKMKENMRLRNRLALELEKSQATINRWMYSNDVMLTTAQCIQIISEETGLTQDQILEKEVA